MDPPRQKSFPYLSERNSATFQREIESKEIPSSPRPEWEVGGRWVGWGGDGVERMSDSCLAIEPYREIFVSFVRPKSAHFITTGVVDDITMFSGLTLR